MKIMYTRPEDGGVSIVIASPKEVIEQILGPLTQEEYEQHIIEKSIPENVSSFKLISDEDLPSNREFRNAWVDVTPDTKVNIDVAKAKELKLAELRRVRNEKLAETDIEFTRALEEGDQEKLEAIKAKRQHLRDATETLKAVEADGVIDDEEMLELIRQLSVLQET